MRAVDVAPGSWCPTDRSPRYEARPFLAWRGMVARMPDSAASAAASIACATGMPSAILAFSVSTAGSSASTIVLSPSEAVPRSLTDASAAARTSTSCAPSNVAWSPSTRPPLRSAEPHSGPLAPPTVDTRVRPAMMSRRPGGDPLSAPRAWTTASKPLFMFVPWSPSPMAASSWTRWSRSTRTDESISRIQELIVAASITFSLIKTSCYALQRSAGHLERCNVAANQVACRFEAGLAQPGVDLAIDKVELEQRRAAHAVDEDEHLAAVLRLQIRDHGLEHHVDDLARSAKRSAPAARLAVDADAELDLPFGQVEDDLS